MISVYAKADVKQQEIKELVEMYLVFFIKKYLQNLKYNAPSGMCFSFNFARDSVQLGPVHQGQGVEGLLSGQNPLSMTKVICLRSLTLVDIPSSFVLSIKNSEWVFFTYQTKSLKHDKSYLSMVPKKQLLQCLHKFF